MPLRPVIVSLLPLVLFLTSSSGWAQSSFSYNLLIGTPDGQSVDSDSAPFAPLGSIIQTAPGDFTANASADADCRQLQIGGGASANGPAAGGPSALTNPGAVFTDSITFTAPGQSGLGTFVTRYELFGVGVATVDDPDSNAGASSSYTFNISNGTCGSLCNDRWSGNWNQFNGATVFSGDPLASYDSDPTQFFFGLPVPISAGLSMVAQASAPLNGTGSTAGGSFAALVSIVEVRDNAGILVAPSIVSDSGCEYVPEPFAPMIASGMLVALVRMRSPHRSRRAQARRLA